MAVFVLSRIAGENADRHDTEGDYFITKEEKSLLAQISASYDSVVLVINTGGLIDLAFTEEFTNIKSIVQFMQAGQEGGSAFADIMSGAVNPSGKMTDSWAYTYLDYPNARTFSHKNGNTDTEKYEEGIFVGYRYFDTFDVPVRYGFGFGLSYTEFSVVGTGVSASGLGTDQPKISVTASVKNTGNTYAGKEVAEVYVSCPQNGMPKEYRRLAGFAKTRLLSPGENQDLTITFPLYQLASYHEDRSAWILEAGTYGIWVGNSLESASLSATISLDADVVMVQCESICERKENLKELIPDAGKMKEKEAAWKSLAESLKLPDLSVCADQIVTETVAYPEHSGVTEGKAGEIVSTLSEEQLIALATGDPGKGQENALGSAGLTVPGAAAETSSAAIESPWNVASMVLADGPAGLRLHKTYQVVDGKINKGSFLQAFEGGFFADPEDPEGTTYYQYCTALPVGTLLAQTWDVNLLKGDEAWTFLQVAQGKALSNKLIRAGRSMNAAVYFVTQNSGDVDDEKMKNNIGLKFAFRSTDISEIKNTLEFFGVDKDDENNQKRLRDLENGQCLFQDLYGRVGVIQIHPVFADLFHAFDTRPPIQTEETR